MSKQEETVVTLVYSKEQLVSSDKYADKRDILAALLEDDKQYTEQQVKQVIDGYEKRTVK